MAKKNECYLCGGKLTNGYCPACGLDNTRIHRKHYHLNESYSVESMNGDTGKASVKCKEKAKQADKKNDSQILYPAQSSQNAGRGTEQSVRNSQNIGNQKAQTVKPFKGAASQPHQPTQMLRNGASSTPALGKVKIAVAVIGLVAVVGGFAVQYVEEHQADTGPIYQSLSSTDYVEEYGDPYDLVKRELSDTGERYETELEPGEYLVGVHLPEGVYTATLLEGSGSLNVDDFENAIYLWQSFGTDEEYDEVGQMEDIRLYTGALVTVDNNVLLQMSTENGQTDQMEIQANPLTDSRTLEKDETITVGEEISPGVYDISAESGWAMLRCKVPDAEYEDGFYEKIYWLGDQKWDRIYRNVYLTEEMEITADENMLLLTPSENIGSGDYEEYYKDYKYY